MSTSIEPSFRLLRTLRDDARVLLADAPPQRSRAEEKLRSFARLPAGWDAGRGGPISDRVIENATLAVDLGLSLGLQVDVFPGADDEVAVALYREDGQLLEAIVSAAGVSELFVQQGTGYQSETIDHQENVSLRALISMIAQWGRGQWSSRESSTPFIWTFSTDASATSPLSQAVASVSTLQTASAASL